MKVKCIENKFDNTNFTQGKEYEASPNGIRSDWGGMWTGFKDWNKPKSFKVGDIFEFAMCRFEIIQ